MGFSVFAKDFRSTGIDLIYYTYKREQISQLLVAKYVGLRTPRRGLSVDPHDRTYALRT